MPSQGKKIPSIYTQKPFRQNIYCDEQKSPNLGILSVCTASTLLTNAIYWLQRTHHRLRITKFYSLAQSFLFEKSWLLFFVLRTKNSSHDGNTLKMYYRTKTL